MANSTAEKPKRAKLEVVIFDIDGVLADNVAYEQKNLEYILDALVEEEDISFVQAQNRIDAVGIKYRGQREAHDWRVLCKELGLGNVWYDAHIANLKYLQPINGALELLDSLHNRVRMVVGTDAIRPVADIKLSYLGMKKYFEKIYSQDDTDSFKGDPAFYEFIMKDLGLRAGQLMYVGNRPERGIRQAQKLGLHTVLMAHPEYLQIREKIPADVEPDLETKDHTAVRDYIFTVAGKTTTS